MSTQNKTLFITQFSILLALEALICFTPLGSLPVGPIVASLMYLPVIATALLLGLGAGAAMGAVAGLFSLLVMTFMPANPLAAFVFTPFYGAGPFTGNGWSLVICFIPRILVGVVTSAVFKAFKNKSVFAYGISAVLGCLVCTVLVLGGIYVFFGAQYAEANSVAHSALLGIIALTVLTNGIPEAILGALVAIAVCRPMVKFMSRR